MSVKGGLSAEERDRQERIKARIAERARWAEFQRIYDRCVAIADATWSDRLDSAQLVQNDLAEGMRDRRRDGVVPAEIPVPLFTPRDREQFIKEVAATLLISADRRNLTALPEPKDAETKPSEGPEAAPEAASGTDELSSVEVGEAPTTRLV